MTYFEAVTRARAVLIDAGLLPDTAALDADLLARHAAAWDHATWLLRRSEQATGAFIERYEQAIQRRRAREPVAYIRGVQEFWGREFLVTPDVLIPRPETELLIESAQAFLKKHPGARVVDVGTGSGCIAISLAAENPSAAIFAVDVSEPALDVARENARRHDLVDRVTFVHGSYLADCPRPVDLVVANPPYVAEHDKPGLAPEVRDHEPAVALFGGRDGWRDISALLNACTEALAMEGRLMMEIGFGQLEALAERVRSLPALALEEMREDLQNIPRLAIVRRA